MQNKFDQLKKLYASYDRETAPYRSESVCTKGCAFCCSEAGSIDVTTLEGLKIHSSLARMPRARRISVNKALKRDFKKREAGVVAPCPFLMKTKACMIYEDRPFACRRVYSLRTCTRDAPPLLSRQVMCTAQATIASIQELDRNGYTGHLSYILHLLDDDGFLATYLAGDFNPEAIMAFGKAHRITINRMVAGGKEKG